MELRDFLVLCSSLASLVKGEGGCRDLNYLDCEKDKALTGHVIKTIRILAPGLEECQHQCFMEGRCVSYNLGPVFGVIQSCELSDADHLEYPDDVKSVPGAEYCPIKNPCSSNPCPKNITCKPDFHFNTFRCIDTISCAAWKRHGFHKSGVYNITPVPGNTVQVYCDQVTYGGGWTVIQKRYDGSVNFYRGWDDYKRGFGNKNGEYWLGLDAIHILTNSSQNTIRIDLKDFEGNAAHALYASFSVSGETDYYALQLGNFVEGKAGDSFGYHNTARFSTFDSDNDKWTHNCAITYKGAWWYKRCHWSNLNGQYLYGQHSSYAEGIKWLTWRGYQYSAKEAEMKIRPADFTDA